MGKNIKINKSQAKMLKEHFSKKKIVISESQLKMIKKYHSENLSESDSDLSTPETLKASSQVSRQFSRGISKPVKKDIGKMFESFVNEVYGLNEDSEGKYSKLISLMEYAGLIENNRFVKEKFNSDKNRLKEVIGKGIELYESGQNEYRVMESIENSLKENGYPAGAEFDDDAPYNQYDDQETEECDTPESFPMKMIHYNEDEDGLAIFEKDGLIYIHMSAYHSEEILNEFCGEDYQEKINNMINYYVLNGGKVSTDPFSARTLLAKVTPRNIPELLKYYGNDEKLKSLVSGIDETTTAGSVGGQYAVGMGASKKGNNVPSYDSNVEDFWLAGNKEMNEDKSEDMARYKYAMAKYKADKTDENKKSLVDAAKVVGIDLPMNENEKKDTQYPKGEFVELDSCTKLNNNKSAINGGCNTGDSGVVKTKQSKNSVISNNAIYETISKKTGKSVTEVKNILEKHNFSKK